jgi:hypothetical protein
MQDFAEIHLGVRRPVSSLLGQQSSIGINGRSRGQLNHLILQGLPLKIVPLVCHEFPRDQLALYLTALYVTPIPYSLGGSFPGQANGGKSGSQERRAGYFISYLERMLVFLQQLEKWIFPYSARLVRPDLNASDGFPSLIGKGPISLHRLWLRSRSLPPDSLHQPPCHTELSRRPGSPYLLPDLTLDRRLSGNALRSGQHQPL